jgi:ParB-like chromosome segregation protein Spo0J
MPEIPVIITDVSDMDAAALQQIKNSFTNVGRAS